MMHSASDYIRLVGNVFTRHVFEGAPDDTSSDLSATCRRHVSDIVVVTLTTHNLWYAHILDGRIEHYIYMSNQVYIHVIIAILRYIVY